MVTIRSHQRSLQRPVRARRIGSGLVKFIWITARLTSGTLILLRWKSSLV